jgi:taurine dioxygenase
MEKLLSYAALVSETLWPSGAGAGLASTDCNLYGATPTVSPYNLYRHSFEACELQLCGGAERLGVQVDVGDLRDLSAEGAEKIYDAVRAHGVVVIKGQNLTRAEQVAFTGKLGEVVVLPASFEGNDPEPGEPAIQRVTNFWSNGTWKGAGSKFGAYWHQDGQFWTTPKHNLFSVLYGAQVPRSGGETGFADLRAARATLSKPLLAKAAKAAIHASVRDIADFAKGKESDLAMFPKAVHPLLDTHYLDDGPILYVGSPHMKVFGLESPEAGKKLLNMLLAHATSPAFQYFHAWDQGDVLVWDNTQTLHHSMPYENDGTNRREYYRTQARMKAPASKAEM